MDSDDQQRRAQDFIEPFDRSPFTPPNGWCGGTVEHTGGGIYCRRWRTENVTLDTAQAGDIAYEVVYNGFDTTVALQQLVYDEQYESFIVENVPYTVNSNSKADASMCRTARELIETHNGLKRPDTEPVTMEGYVNAL